MTYATKQNDAWIALVSGQSVIGPDEVQASYDTVMLWSDAERQAFGVFAIPEADAPPVRKIEASRVLVDNNGAPAWQVTYADAPPPPAPTPPAIISDRQFFQQLALMTDPSRTDGSTIISQADALAAVRTGTVPPAMQPLISGLPSSAQFAAEMKLSGATQFDIADPVTLAIAQAYGWSSAQLAAFWTEAAAL